MHNALQSVLPLTQGGCLGSTVLVFAFTSMVPTLKKGGSADLCTKRFFSRIKADKRHRDTDMTDAKPCINEGIHTCPAGGRIKT